MREGGDMTAEPKKLTEPERAEILQALRYDGTTLHDKLRAHFLYEDMQALQPTPQGTPREEKINHPKHYNMGGPKGPDGSAQYEVIKIIEDLGWGYGFCMGNALKYSLRAPHKGSEQEDWKKAGWYLDRAVRPINEALIRPPSRRQINALEAARAWAPVRMDAHAVINAICHGNAEEALRYL